VIPKEKSALLRRLRDDLSEATREYLRIQRELDRILMDVPSGLPLSDGQHRIVSAGERARYAFKQYERALGKLRDFVNDGVAPDNSEGTEPGPGCTDSQ
jgi:hypothetical protein